MNKTWIKSAIIRAVKTVCQTAAAMIGTAVVLEAVDWQMLISASLLAGILSILTSLAGLPEVQLTEALDFDSETDESREDIEAKGV